MKNFISPHVHVKSLDSGSTPEQFAKREVELGTGYITVTDHGTLEATRLIYDLTKEKKAYKGLTPILGLEGYFRDDNCPILTEKGVQKGEDGSFRDHIKYHHITLHAQDELAFSALTRILSDADLRAEKHGTERKPLFTWQNLEELGSYNVTGTSGCLIGMVSRHLLQHNDPRTAIKYYEKTRSLFKPGNFYVEVFPHRCDTNWESGIFVTDQTGMEKKYGAWKQFKTQKGIVKAEALAEEFKKNAEKALKEHVQINEVMDQRKWTPLETPVVLSKVEKREGFLQNECRPWCPDGDVQLGANKFLIRLAQNYGDPVLISDDSHFAYPDEKIVQDIRLAQHGGAWKFANSYHRQSSDEAYKYFKHYLDVPEAKMEEWIENTHAWAAKFKGFKFSSRKTLPTSFYPEKTLEHTMALIKKNGRMQWDKPEYVARLKAEIDLLYKNGTVDLLPYFMIDEEVCDLYTRAGELTGPGRGSAAGLLLAYLLGITHKDPIRYKLSMDRFMTLDRIQTGKLPDIDQDLPHRNLLVDPEDDTKGWLRDRFGECVAQISTDTTIKLKSAIKDIFRAQNGYVAPEIEAICKLLPNPPQGINDRDYVFGYKNNDGQWVPGQVEESPVLQGFMKRYPREWDIVQKLLGIARQKSRHACAYVIADGPIKDFIPLTSVGGVRVTQFTAPAVEASGGLKMDFLTVNSLKDIGNAIKLIQQRHQICELLVSKEDIPSLTINGLKVPKIRAIPYKGNYVDIWDLPEDPAVFRDICEGRVETVFQFDAGAARQGLKFFHPDGDKLPLATLEDLSAFTALDRPGPLDYKVKDEQGNDKHNMLVEFAARASGKAPTGALPILNKLLPETYGVIVYQEQLQAVFQNLGGTTAIEANNFRQRISKKKLVEVNAIDKPLFMKGAVPKLGEQVASRLWDSMETFGQYGFNKSHAVCYVTISYACAFLKHHYPLEWWTAVLQNADRSEIDEKFWRYCGKWIDLPDIHLSDFHFSIKNERIRAPLTLLKGLGEKASQQLELVRHTDSIAKLLQSIEEWRVANATMVEKEKEDKKTGIKTKGLFQRKATTALNDTVLKNLIVTGAMDSLFPEKDSFGEPLTVVDKLAIFEETAATVRGKKVRKGTSSKYNLQDRLVQFQFRKKVLPAYTEPIVPLIKSSLPDRLVEYPTCTMFKDDYQNEWKVVGGNEFEVLEQIDNLSSEEEKVVVLAYVVSDRRFGYTQKSTGDAKTAADLSLDVDGIRISAVRWPSKQGLPAAFKENLEGSVIACHFTRGEDSQTFFLADVSILAPSLKQTEDENEASP
jgi:DNA-directed DNA polymerase III PolC